MINNENISTAREVWLTASKIFGFKIITPYRIIVDGLEKEAFGFLPEYGTLKGTLVQLTSPPNFETDEDISKWAKENNFSCSFINIEMYLEYNEARFKDTLEDWGKFYYS
jgi:hypothetical protein